MLTRRSAHAADNTGLSGQRVRQLYLGEISEILFFLMGAMTINPNCLARLPKSSPIRTVSACISWRLVGLISSLRRAG
jgi:hypothetical protein